MEFTFKLLLAVIAGCLVFFLMRKMTKWVFRIMIVAIIIAVVFYSSITLEDVKGIFKEEPAKEPVIEEPAAGESPEITENITIEENATTSLAGQGLQ